MERRRGRLVCFLTTAVTIGVCATLTGCTGAQNRVPTIAPEEMGIPLPQLEPGVAPLYSWRSEQDGIMTYWGPQRIVVTAGVVLPDSWAAEGDERWSLTARNESGQLIPWIGFIRERTISTGSKESRLVPPIDLDRMPDGLYLALIPGIQSHGAQVTSIQPVASLLEIRHHTFKPFRYDIPLAPLQESALTPAPPAPEKAPIGTVLPGQ